MKIGLLLPHLEGTYENGTAGWAELSAIARTAEDVGFGSLWIADHLLYRIPGIEEFGTWECWSLVNAVAAITSRVEIGTMVSVTPWRNPGILAKIIDTAEEVSGGRIIAGLGAGSHDAEFPVFGFDSWDHRVTRFTEEIDVLSKLLREGRVDHDGRFHTLRDAVLRPRGPRPQGPPIMIGAVGPKMLALTVKYADMWNIPWCHELERLDAELERGEAACREAGRDPASLEKSVCLQIDLPRTDGSTRNQLMDASRQMALKGTPDEIAGQLKPYKDAGVSHVQLWLDPVTPQAVESFGEVLDRV